LQHAPLLAIIGKLSAATGGFKGLSASQFIGMEWRITWDIHLSQASFCPAMLHGSAEVCAHFSAQGKMHTTVQT